MRRWLAGGGSTALPVPAVATADLFARAIIAAARSYGDAPDRAWTDKARTARRALAAAVSGMTAELGLPVAPVARVLGLNRTQIYVSRKNATPPFLAAERAVRDAVRYASWHPEAAASVVEAGSGAAKAEPPSFALPPRANAVRVERALDEPPAKPAVPRPPRPAAEREAPAGPIYRRPTASDLGQRVGPATTLPAKWSVKPNLSSVPAGDRPVTDLILAALQGEVEGLNTLSLAYRVDRKEMAVSSALAALQHDGKVLSAAVENGPRRLVWRLA